MDALALAALALIGGAAVASNPIVGLMTAGAVTLVVRRRLGWVGLVFAWACLAGSALRAHLAADDANARYEQAVRLLGPAAKRTYDKERCIGTFRILKSPIVRGGRPRIDGQFLDGQCGSLPIPTDTRARLYNAPDDLRRGDEVWLVAEMAPIRRFDNPELSDSTNRIAKDGIAITGAVLHAEPGRRAQHPAAWVDSARNRVRRRIEATYHPEARPMARALILGETDLADDDLRAFQRSGLSHLLAVSGTHLVLSVVAVASLLRAILVRVPAIAERWDVGRIVAAVAVPLAWLYADFAGGGGSALRAAAMLSASMGARVLSRRPNAVRALVLSAISAWILDPLAWFDASFSLSAAATLGLITFSRPFADALRLEAPPTGLSLQRRALRALIGTMTATLAATIACTPIILMLSPQVPTLGVLANIVAAPVGELAALPVCLLHAITSSVPPLESGAAIVGSGALMVVRDIAHITEQADLNLALPPPTSAQCGALVVFLVGLLTAIRPLKGNLVNRGHLLVCVMSFVLAVGVFEWCAVRDGAPPDRLRVSLLDVGQGDGLLVDLPDGASMLVDAGGFVGSPVDTGSRVVAPVLRSRRRKHIDVVVISHPHPDHYLGMAAALESVTIGEVWHPQLSEVAPSYERLLQSFRDRGAIIRTPPDLCGRPRTFGEAEIQVIGPCPAPHSTWSANDNSLVISARLGERSILLTGDAEEAAEASLLSSGRPLRTDALKVGHHGSRTSTSPAFLAATQPQVALVSCGIRNRFDHPHPQTLTTLQAAGVPLLRTDMHGQVRWETDGSQTWITKTRSAGVADE